MHIKIKYQNPEGTIRLENKVDVKEVLMKEDFLNPDKESISIGFRNDISSGLIEFTSEEFDRFARDVKKRSHLVKGVKIFRE